MKTFSKSFILWLVIDLFVDLDSMNIKYRWRICNELRNTQAAILFLCPMILQAERSANSNTAEHRHHCLLCTCQSCWLCVTFFWAQHELLEILRQNIMLQFESSCTLISFYQEILHSLLV